MSIPKTKLLPPFAQSWLISHPNAEKILINTSYNIHEQPIVRTAEEAIQTFNEGNIDALVLNDSIITRK